MKNGLTDDQIKVFANPDYTSEEMSNIRECFELGLTTEQVEFCIEAYFDWKKADARNGYPFTLGLMGEIRKDIQRGVPLDVIKLYVGWKRGFRKGGINDEIRKDVIEKRFPEEQIRVYADLEFTKEQSKEIRDAFKEGLSMEQVRILADPMFNADQMYQIRWGLQDNLSQEQINLLANPEFNSHQMREIRKGFADGLTMEQVKAYAAPRVDFHEMAAIREGLKSGKFVVCSLAEAKFNTLELDLEKIAEIIEEEKNGKI